MGYVDGVSATAVVDVVTPVARQQLVIAEIVDALVAEGGSEVIAFAGVVVDDIEDDFEAGVVKAVDHVPEFVRAARSEIGGVRAEEIQAVVTPVVDQSLVQHVELAHEGVYRHQFHRGDAQCFQVFDDLGPGQTGEGSPQRFRHVRMQLGEPLDVTFIDHGLRPGRQRPAANGRRPAFGGHHRLGHMLRIVATVGGEIEVGIPEFISEMGRVPAEFSRQRPGIGIEQEFRRVEAVAGMGCVRTMYAIAVACPCLQSGDVAMPDAVGLLRQKYPVDQIRPAFVVKTKFDRLGVSRIQRESRSLAIETGAHYAGVAGFDASI